MKISLLLIFFSSLHLFAADTYSQLTRLTLHMEQVKIKDVLIQIENQSEFYFLYNGKLVDVDKTVSVRADNQLITDVISQLFDNKDVAFRVVDRQIVLMPASLQTDLNVIPSASFQDISISGIVTDDHNEPLIGVNVQIKGTTIGAVTDIDGRFTVSVPNNQSVLVFSYVGYLSQEITVGSRQVINVTMREDTQSLDELVVIGYGIQKKVNLTGSVAYVEGETLAKRPVVNITQSLQGVIPGLNTSVTGSSGKPGSGLDLNIRGQGNLSDRNSPTDSPYILVDGLEMSLNDVNPHDIENISVLKDAAAAAIYGARAAYGVILITTKKGKEGKMHISYDGNIGFSQPIRLPDMVNSYEFAKYFNTANYNALGTRQYSDEKLALLEQYVKNPAGINCWPEINSNSYESFENTANGVGNTNYFALHYKNLAFKQNHNLSMSGGSQLIQYYISGGFYNEQSILRYADMEYKRFSMNANITSKVTDWLKFKVNTKFSSANNESPFGDGAIDESSFFHNMARFRPTVSAYDLYGNFTELTQIPYLQSGTRTETNDSNLGLLTGMEIEPVKNLRVFLDYNYKKGTTDYDALALPAQIVGVNGQTYLGIRPELNIPAKGSYRRAMAKSDYNSVNLYTNYALTLNSKHNFLFLLGFQNETYYFSQLQTIVRDLISFSTPSINLSTGDQIPTESRNHWATMGYFGRINYDFEGRYLFEANARYDGSSRFSKNTRWGWFPSASVGWNIANESFMENTRSILTTLKLRGSFGLLGNQSGANMYTFAETLNTTPQSNWYFQNGRDLIINAPGSYNPLATWEKVEYINGGLDFSFLNNRLTGSFDLYQRTTRDMLGPSADLADMYGTTAPQTNNAVMRNRGWELSINYRGQIGKDITYSIGGMLVDYNAIVLEYENPTLQGPAANWYPGKKVGEIWGYRADGLIQTQAEADEYNKYDLTFLTGQPWKPGDVKYRDLNGDGKINRGLQRVGDMGDVEIIGNSSPRYTFSINGSISWKGLTLSMLWQGVGKRDYDPANSVYFFGAGSFAQVTVFNEHLDYWRGPDDPDPNPGAYYPNPYAASAAAIDQYRNKTMQTCDRYLQNASYIRLKNLILNYDLPISWINKMQLERISIFFSGENMLTFSSMAKMFDPETALVFREGGKNYPLNKVYSMGLIINY